MSISEYDSLITFPIEMVSLVRYEGPNIKLKPGDSFIGIKKVILCEDDYSIIDQTGSPHHYTGCDLLIKE